ncbi:MAG: DUF5615 family PIN-like protein [Thermoleophilia bacterium]
MRFLLDAMITAELVGVLAERGIEAEAIDGVPSLLGLSDPDVLRRARDGRQVLVTHNREDFCRLGRAAVSEGEGHFGIILVTGHIVRIGWLAAELERIAREAGAADLRNREVWL